MPLYSHLACDNCRFQCGVPVIIEGETGVGKTTLIEMLSKLWNHALLAQWEDRRESLVDLLKQKLGGLCSMTCSTASLARRSLFSYQLVGNTN